MSKWQPIETHPKDDTLVIVYQAPEPGLRWSPLIVRGDDLIMRDRFHWMAKATYWMPLPEPPK